MVFIEEFTNSLLKISPPQKGKSSWTIAFFAVTAGYKQRQI
jgi:hypothetical protein